MRLFTGHSLAGGRRHLAEEAFPRSLPPAWQALAAVLAARRMGAAHCLSQAQRDVHRTCAEKCRAEAEVLREQRRAHEFEGEWHRALRHRQAQGRDIHKARAMQAQRETALAKQKEQAGTLARNAAQARENLDYAQHRYGMLARKQETWRALRQRFDAYQE
jgi:hypothetical protein